MKKNRIEVKDGAFLLNGKAFFLYAGEIHYFRVPKDKWTDRIKKAKETGLNTISTYIPWSWHEYEEGKFDFSGRTYPQRDLLSFIKLVNNNGLFLIARVGPTSNAEIKGEGIPLWFLRNYEEARAKNRKGGNVLHEAIVAYMHPVFQDRVSKWYERVLPIVRNNMSHKGGPIILLQLDNEIGMMHWVMNSPDYNESTTRLYDAYLDARYKGDLNLLNDKYYTNHISFDEIVQPKGDVDEEGVIRCWDWVAFYRDYYARYYRTLADRAHKHKITLPFTVNIPMFWDYNICARADQGLMTIMQFRDFTTYTPHLVFGGAYQMRNLNFENFHDVILMIEGVNMISDGVGPNICAETQVGGMNDRPRIYPSDINLLMRTAIGHGQNGLNAYMFCGGVNSLDFGFRGTYHEWQSPITSRGKRTSRLKPMEEMGTFLRTFGSEISATKKRYDVSIGLYAPYYETGFLQGSVVEQFKIARDKLFFDGIARLLTLNGFSYNLVDIQRIRDKDLGDIPAMWVFSLDYMDKETQVKLVEYVRRGGTLIMSPTPPTKNMGLLREDILLREMEVSIVESIQDNLVFVAGKDYAVEGDIKVFESKKRRLVARTRERKPCGIIKKVKKGRFLLLGFGVMHTLDYHIDLISHFMQMLNLEPAVKVTPLDVHAVMRANKKYGFLTVANFNDEPAEATLHLRIPGLNKTVKIPQEGSMLLHNRSAYILPLNVPLSRRAKIRYSSAEIVRTHCTEKEVRLTFHGSAGGSGEMCLEMRKPQRITVDGEEVYFKHKDGVLKFSTKLNGKMQEAVIV